MTPDEEKIVRIADKMAKAKDWRGELIITEKGAPRPLLANAIIALRSAPEWSGALQFDEFHQRPMLRGKAPWMDSAADTEWTGAYDVLAADWLQHAGIHVSPDVTTQAVDAVARERGFHPVRDYLESCVWGGAPRLDTWLTAYLGAEDTPYVRAVGAKWMISAVARVMMPGCKADCMLVVEGPQGLLKSTAIKTLAHPWFTDEVAAFGTKDASMQLAGRWVLEISELDSISRAEMSTIKSFMSRGTDRFRPPYGRRVIELPRQCVFAGSVNHGEYLRDDTGGRRFWPVVCGKIDIESLADVRDRLWAEACHRYRAGESWWLDEPTIEVSARAAQDARYQEDAWIDKIREWLGIREDCSVGEVMDGALFLTTEKWTQRDMNRVASCLRRLGWERYQRRDGTHRQWRYRPSPVSPEGVGKVVT